MNIIKRDVYVLEDQIKWPIDYLQGTNAIPIEFTFRDFDIPTGAKVRVYVSKPSRKGIFENVLNVSGNVVTVDVSAQMVAEVGAATMQVEVVKEEDILATFVQPINVKATSIPINSESGSQFIEDLLQDVEEATNRANETTDRMEQKAQNGDFSATVNVGETITSAPGTAAAVTNSGTIKDVVLNFSIPRGAKGESGVTAPSEGMFSLWVDSETGNLYVDYPDGTTAPRFELEENGDLYYVFD